jgi:hypothetical protein
MDKIEVKIGDDGSIVVKCKRELEAEIRETIFTDDFPGGTDDVTFVYTN